MPAERAGYTVTMFLVDLSPSMRATRTVEIPEGKGETRSVEMTKLEWSLQFVKMKIQEMIFNGRKTDQCGVITFGSEETNNIIHDNSGGYDHVSEYIPIGQPNAGTLAKLDELEASETAGDSVDALIVGIETQSVYLDRKPSWTRKIVLVTDGESPMEIEEWEAIVAKMAGLTVALTVVGVDFDDEKLGYEEENKSAIKRVNEGFYARLILALPDDLGLLGSLERALGSVNRPQVKEVKSALSSMTLRLGDVEVRESEAIEFNVRVAKCTSSTKPASWKQFFKKEIDEDEMQDIEDEGKTIYKEIKKRSEYFIDKSEKEEGGEKSAEDVSMDVDEEKSVDEEETHLEKVEKEQLIKGFKYGSTYVPCPDGQFDRLKTRKGMEICGFIQKENLNRSYLMGEISYVFGSPTSVPEQLAFSSVVQAMHAKEVLAVARMVRTDGGDPKMGVLSPVPWGNLDMLLWAQMPFADDVRHYTFPSLLTLISRSGEKITKHPYIPTEEQLEAMDKFIDGMDLTNAEKDEDGSLQPWFDSRLSYNPAVHRIKQAQFHCAVVSDVASNPVPPPHPELTRYFEPPKRVLKTAKPALEACIDAFKVKEVPKKVVKTRKDGHMYAQDQDEDMILLDQKGPARSRPVVPSPAKSQPASPSQARAGKKKMSADDSETESESDEEFMMVSKPEQKLPTPAPTASPEPEPGPQRAPGRIIGNAYPLRDFRENLKQGDVVTKAVEDLGVVVREIVGRPFGNRRRDEMVECLKVLREACIKEDEIDAWNEILRGLKNDCLDEHGNKDFWAEMQKAGRDMSLISAKEAQRVGAISDVSEAVAEDFMQE